MPFLGGVRVIKVSLRIDLTENNCFVWNQLSTNTTKSILLKANYVRKTLLGIKCSIVVLTVSKILLVK